MFEDKLQQGETAHVGNMQHRTKADWSMQVLKRTWPLWMKWYAY